MLANTLKALRTRNGYTQKNISDFLGIERSTYTYYETGKTKPSAAILERLSCLYHVNIEEFLPSSYKPSEDFDLESPSPDDDVFTRDTERFSKLTPEEQRLIMYFRACPDKRRLLDCVKDAVVGAEEDQT